jgi:hypothetical protein
MIQAAASGYFDEKHKARYEAELRRIVLEAFLELHKEIVEYRGFFLIAAEGIMKGQQ